MIVSHFTSLLDVLRKNIRNGLIYLQTTKRRKLRGISIPQVQTNVLAEKKISIEQLSSFKDLLENIDTIEVNNQSNFSTPSPPPHKQVCMHKQHCFAGQYFVSKKHKRLFWKQRKCFPVYTTGKNLWKRAIQLTGVQGVFVLFRCFRWFCFGFQYQPFCENNVFLSCGHLNFSPFTFL